MTSETIGVELQKKLKLNPCHGETPSSFARRLATKANEVPDGEWKKFSDEAQAWVNSYLEAEEKSKSGEEVDLPELEGNPASAASAEPPEAADEVPAKKAKANSAKKPKAAAPAKEKPAKEKPAPKVAKEKKPSSGKGPRASGSSVISALVKGNPYRSGTKAHAFFNGLKTGMTVSEALASTKVPGIYLWNARRDGFVTIK